MSPDLSERPHHNGLDEIEFRNKLHRFSDNDKDSILGIYRFAKEIHHGQQRVNKDQYFEHLRATALILVDECQIDDPDIIKAALLHDGPEDTLDFGNPEGKTYATWRKHVYSKLSWEVSPRVARMVLGVTRPPKECIDIGTKENSNRIFYEQVLTKAMPGGIIIKLADRLHNMRTQYHMSPDKQLGKIDETLEDLLPLVAKRDLGQYRKAANMLVKNLLIKTRGVEARLITQQLMQA